MGKRSFPIKKEEKLESSAVLQNDWEALDISANFTPTFSLTCVMSWARGHSESRRRRLRGSSFCPAISQGVSVSDVLFNTAVCIFGTWLPHRRGRRKEGDGGVAGLQNGVTIECLQTCRTTAGSHQTTGTPVSRRRSSFARCSDERTRKFSTRRKLSQDQRRGSFFFSKWRNRTILSWWMFWASVWGRVYSRVMQLDFWCLRRAFPLRHQNCFVCEMWDVF